MMRMPDHFCALALTCAVVPAFAGDGSPAHARILEGWRNADGTHMAAIAINLAPGWKTYWRSPGDAGIPPVFTWDGSENLLSLGVAFPVPEVMDQNGIRSIGYSSDVVFPIRVVPDADGEDIRLNGTLNLGVCRDVCIPVEIAVTAVLPASATEPNRAILASLDDRPMTRREGGVANVACEAEPIRDGLRLTASIDMPGLARKEVAVVEYGDRTVWVSEADTSRSGGRLTAIADLVPPDAAPFLMAREAVRITILGGGKAVEIDGCN